MTRPKAPYLFAVIIIVLTLIFFWKILLTNLILSGVDVFLYFYPYKAYTAEALRQGRLPLWNPHLFMGVPLLANSQVGLFYPPNWLFIGFDAPKQVAWAIGLHIVLAGLFMLTFARQSLRLSWLASLIAAILFAFGGYLGAQVEHINQLQAAAWLPLLFWLYDLGLKRRPGWPWFLLLALAVAITLLAGHAQTTFISLFGLGLYALWQAIAESEDGPLVRLAELRPAISPIYIRSLGAILSHLPVLTISLSRTLLRYLGPLILVSILALALAAVQLLPTTELSAQSIRSGGLTFRETVSFSLRPTNLHYTLLPPFNLDLTQPLGQAFSEWVAYLGLSGLLLSILGALTLFWSSLARRFLFISSSGLLLSLGLFTGPLYLLLYKVVPGFNLFRVPARWLLLYAFGMAVLAGLGSQALQNPTELSARLNLIWRWVLASHWRLIISLLPFLCLFVLIIWKTPPVITLLAWLIFALITCGLIHYLIRASYSAPQVTDIVVTVLIILLLLELFWAAQSLNYNHPTAPQAYHSMRNAVAFLLANDPPDQAAPPDRFLSLSGITYDPGDLADLERVYGPHLTEKALYDLIVATKEKEVLFFNIPMIYGLHSVDGYDGGILPLAQFVTLQQLFLPPDDLSIDGRLREKLRFVPANQLLSLLNTRWIITDKQFDVWIDGIFYDLQFPAYLAPGQIISAAELPDFPPTAVGLVSHLEEAASLPEGSPVAELNITFTDGDQESFVLKAGLDTAEGNYQTTEEANPAHPQARIGVTWPYDAAGVDYITIHTLAAAQSIADISVKALLPAGQFVMRGLTLIHQPTNTSRSVILSTQGDYRQVHSGDVKIYENRAVLPRAYIVHQAELVSSDKTAIKIMQAAHFDPRQKLVRVSDQAEQTVRLTRGQPAPDDQATIRSYTPERVEIDLALASPGWLILTDAYYPGWQATIDGQATDIFRANILFRAVEIPDGKHIVVFEFKPHSFRRGMWITTVILVILILALARGLNYKFVRTA